MRITIFKSFVSWHSLGVLILSLFWLSNTCAANHTVNFVVAYKTVNFAGKQRQAIAVNNQIPAPTLHFKEGDHVTINVYNHLNKDTAIHWHGMLVPWQMDGVEGISQKPIPPGGVFHYHFTLRQAGTYWYHAHAGLQEQQGLYGAFVIDPVRSPSYQYTKDYLIVLSDWSNTYPEQILANLKKDGDYYSPRLPLQASLVRFIRDYRQAETPAERQHIVDDYKMMQQMRMSIYDISDVAYDAFLLNGQPNSHAWTAPVRVGDVVRLRFIGASSSTNFRVKVVGATMRMVHIEGNDVKPYTVEDFSITPGETYDVLVKIQKNQPYIIYAESADTLGVAYGALVTSSQQFVNYRQVRPFPEPLPVTREMMANMMGGMTHGSMKMNMDMPTESTIRGDVICPANSYKAATTGTKYQHLAAAVKTNNPNKQVNGIIRMELFGYMDHFIWMINGLPEYKTKPIVIEPGKRYRIIFTNNSMMHHPMHIHGHWFILRNGHGVYDPLLHTIDVPPGATVVADIDADASGQWFFHCHHLYHMMSGMSRVFQYSTILEIAKGAAKPESFVAQQSYLNRPIVREDETRRIDVSLIRHPMAHPPGFYFSSLLDVGEDPFNNVQKATFKGLYGSDYNKLELFTNDAEVNQETVQNADLDIFYWHLISQFWAIKGGVNYFYRPAERPYWQPGAGIEGLMPYFIDTDVRAYYHNGSAKLDVELSRDTQITDNFFVRLGARGILATKTVVQDEVGSGLNTMRYIIRPYYRLMPGINLFAEFEHEKEYGPLATIYQNNAEDTSENTLTFGVTVLF
jgi:FtsP/CotA-like multicopper oxidase with cupredoxin domain/uncharacterized protein involved in copper resistance